MEDGMNRREFTRIPIQLAVKVASTPPLAASYHIRDISLNGLYLNCAQPLPIGTECQVTFLLGASANPIRIEVVGKVVRGDANGMGLEVTTIVGVESFEHLRNLVLYNSPETERVEQEIHGHIGIKRRE